MIFALGQSPPALFVFVTASDVKLIQEGRTLFVDQRQLGGKTFDRVILAFSKTNQDAIDLLTRSGTYKLPEGQIEGPTPYSGEARCATCESIVQECTLFEKRCIVCWATEAKKARIGSN